MLRRKKCSMPPKMSLKKSGKNAGKKNAFESTFPLFLSLLLSILVSIRLVFPSPLHLLSIDSTCSSRRKGFIRSRNIHYISHHSHHSRRKRRDMPLASLHPLPNNPTTGQQPLANLGGRGLAGPPPASSTGSGGVSRETWKGLQDVVWSDDEVSEEFRLFPSLSLASTLRPSIPAPFDYFVCRAVI